MLFLCLQLFILCFGVVNKWSSDTLRPYFLACVGWLVGSGWWSVQNHFHFNPNYIDGVEVVLCFLTIFFGKTWAASAPVLTFWGWKVWVVGWPDTHRHDSTDPTEDEDETEHPGVAVLVSHAWHVPAVGQHWLGHGTGDLQPPEQGIDYIAVNTGLMLGC